MGFFKFLKREKKESLDELDLPPSPPSLEGFEEGMELPEFPEFPEERISAPKEEELPKFDFPEAEGLETQETMPELPLLPEIEEKPITPIPPVSAPPITQPAPQIPQPVSEPEQSQEEQPSFTQDVYPKIERRLFAQADENQRFSGHRKFEEFSREKRALRERTIEKTIYVRVDNFKATLGSINMVRSDLRKSEEALMKLENVKNAKDKSFDKVKTSLDDLQKKLIFIDKTLFKGD